MAPEALDPPAEESIIDLLRGVVDPELGADIVELGMLRSVSIDPDGVVDVEVGLTTLGCPLRAQIQGDVRSRIESLPGVTSVTVSWSELSAEDKAATMSRARRHAADSAGETAVPSSARVLAIASGKGGVGKSSVTTNVAAALAARGFAVGVIDADIWGFSIPRMLGMEGRLDAERSAGTDAAVIRPMSLPVGSGRLDVVSMGFLVEDEEEALLWRGLMLNRAVQHFLEDVAWSDDLDYVVIDMPPGTGDVAMGLARLLPRTEMIVVTTPATGAQKVASRAITMARKCHVRVAGIIENMSGFVDPAGVVHHIFGEGGGHALSTSSGVPLIGQVPIEAQVSTGGDLGQPVALGDGTAADAFRDIATRLAEEIAVPLTMDGCSSRLLRLVEEALDAEGT